MKTNNFEKPVFTWKLTRPKFFYTLEEELQLHLHLDMHCLQVAKLAGAPLQSHRLTHLDLEPPPHRHCAMQRRGGAHAGQSSCILSLMQSVHTLPSAKQALVSQTAVIRITAVATTEWDCNDLPMSWTKFCCVFGLVDWFRGNK